MRILLVAAALAAQPPVAMAQAQPAPTSPVSAQEATLRIYSEWLAVIDAVHVPLERQMREISAMLGTMDWTGDLTPVLERIRAAQPGFKAEIERTNARLQLLDLPDTSASYFPDDLRPIMYLRNQIAINIERGRGLDAMIPVLDRAQHGSIGELERAARAAMAISIAQADASLLRARAGQAIADPGSLAWLFAGADIIGARLDRALHLNSVAAMDQSGRTVLVADLAALADETDRLLEQWDRWAAVHSTDTAAMLAEAEAAGDEVGIRYARATQIETEALQRARPHLAQLATLLRAGARELGNPDRRGAALSRFGAESSNARGSMIEAVEEAVQRRNVLYAPST